MTRTAAEVVCYIQPLSASCEVMHWIDTGCTTVLRREVSSLAEAQDVLAEARRIAAAVGRPAIVKRTSYSVPGGRYPAHVRGLFRGHELVNTAAA